jgi:Xaa-Pro aminopeptidase
MFASSLYRQRRNQLGTLMAKGIILLPGNQQSSMSYRDNHYPFRQDSTFLYYFGLNRPELVGLIDLDKGDELLFGDDISIEDLVWTGPVETLAAEASQVGVSHIRRLKELKGYLDTARSAGTPIHFLPPYRPEHTLQLHEWLDIPIREIPGSVSVPLIKAIVSMRSIKGEEEVAEIIKGVNVTNSMQLAAMKYSREGMTEAQMAGKLQGIAIAGGGNLAFPTIFTTNGQILHNHYSENKLAKGRLVICDCGASVPSDYSGDLTRTFPVDRAFTPMQKDVYQIVLQAQEAASAALKPGVLYKDVHLLACSELVKGLQGLGLMTGDVDESVRQGAHALFFQCGTGHMLGLDTHDMENLGEPYVGYTDTLTKSTQFGMKFLRLARTLEPGFVVTVEPGLYFIPELMDEWKAEKKLEQFINYDKLDSFRNFGGIRIEEDFLITPTGRKLLGDPLPKTVNEIENLRSCP